MGEKTLNEYFYKPAYKDKGVVEMNKFDAALDVADAEIKANKDVRHTQGTDYSNIVICANYDHPDDAITAISTDNKTLLVTEVETCDTSFTVPANVCVKFERGGKWAISTGITVTFNGQIDAGLWEIFTCTGTGNVILNSGSTPEAYPEWWGAKGDGATDDAAIFNSVLTQLNASQVKTMKLNSYSYLITDTIIMYAGISIKGNNNYPSTLTQSGVNQPSLTKIIFAPTSEKDLFDITTVGAYSYVAKVYLGGMNLYGNTTGGVTYSRYAINSKAAHSIFENLGIERFQDGIYCNYDMTNKYRDIYIGNCSHACIYTSTLPSTSDIFDNVIMRESPWGAIIRKGVRFTFNDCLFESLTTGGVNVYKECYNIDFISCYSEAVPNSAAGDDYGMFYLNYDGASLAGGGINIRGGYFKGNNSSSFLRVNLTAISELISVSGVFIQDFTNGIYVNDAAAHTIYLESISYANITNLYVGTATKLRGSFGSTSAELAEIISDEIGSGKLVFGTSDTWTMGISFGGGTTGITYYANTGGYTKIGNIVSISGQVVLTNKGSSTGNAIITGLPFAAVNSDAGYVAVTLRLSAITFANQFQGRVSKNTTVITLEEITEAGVVTALTDADFANNSSIMVNCTYRIE